MLRPGGLLAFCCTHPLLYLTWDDANEQQTRKLQIDYSELGRHGVRRRHDRLGAPAGTWIQVLRANGFEIEDLVELCAGDDASTTYGEFAPPKWARRWPAEWIWKARRR